MACVHFVAVTTEDSGVRLDRWFRRRYPTLSHNRLEKLLRTGQVRVDGQCIAAGYRLKAKQLIRIPPLLFVLLLQQDRVTRRYKRTSSQQSLTKQEITDLYACILYQDNLVLAINKPAGLAVQGGTAITRHLDGMLDFLRFEASERPRLVHRLDRDTSGVLLLARTLSAASILAETFRSHAACKTYWAVVAGVPPSASGRLSAPISKGGKFHRECVTTNENKGKIAITNYRIMGTIAERASWLELIPYSGRTHQLRAHCALLGTPILGDIKYGSKIISTFQALGKISSRYLYLHARTIVVPNPTGSGLLDITAPPHHT